MTPPVVFLAVLFVLPLAIMALFTFRGGSFGLDTSQPWTLEHYQKFIANTTFLRVFWRSIVLSFEVSTLCILLAYPIAYYLSFHAGPKRITLLTMILVPAWISYLLRVLSWKIILGGTGFAASFLMWLGLVEKGVPILIYSPAATVITLVYVWVPFIALPIFAAIERIDPSLLEASADLGGNKSATFLRVTLPLSLPGIIAGFLFVFIPTVGEYVTPMLVGGPKGVMFGNMIWGQFMRALNWPMGSLMSLVMFVAVLLPIIIVARFVRLSDLAGV
jgi:spermidine/putrescine transport system permease protein